MNDSLNLELTFQDIISASSAKLMSGGYLSIIDIIIYFNQLKTPIMKIIM